MVYANKQALLVVSIFFPIAGVIAVALRFWGRTRGKARLWLDDWLILPALVLEAVLAAIIIFGAGTDILGDHLPNPTFSGGQFHFEVEYDKLAQIQKIAFHAGWISPLALGSLKLSVLFFYRKVFCPPRSTNGNFDLATKTMIGSVAAWIMIFFFADIFACGANPSAAWTVPLDMEQCGSITSILEAFTISDFVTDLLIWALPLPKIWSLQLTLRRKLAICAVFLVGLLMITASGARMTNYILFINGSYNTLDAELQQSFLMFWLMMEAGIGLVVVCMPSVRGLFGMSSPSSSSSSSAESKRGWTSDSSRGETKSAGRISTGSQMSGPEQMVVNICSRCDRCRTVQELEGWKLHELDADGIPEVEANPSGAACSHELESPV